MKLPLPDPAMFLLKPPTAIVGQPTGPEKGTHLGRVKCASSVLKLSCCILAMLAVPGSLAGVCFEAMNNLLRGLRCDAFTT